MEIGEPPAKSRELEDITAGIPVNPAFSRIKSKTGPQSDEPSDAFSRSLFQTRSVIGKLVLCLGLIGLAGCS